MARLGVLNFEMETSALFTLAAIGRLKAGAGAEAQAIDGGLTAFERLG